MNRLERMLALVPYLAVHPETPLSDVAARFGVDERTIRADLDVVFMCGLPGYTPGDLINVVIDDADRITVTNADVIARPPRLTEEQAVALVVAARSLAEVPGLAERDALDRALTKLEAVLGDAFDGAPAVAVALDAEGEHLRLLEDAVRRQRRVHLRYHSATRDELTERDVDPMRVSNVDGRWYLEGWCRSSEGVRMFRVDRVVAAEVLDVAAEVPGDVELRDVAEGVFQPSEAMPLVVLELAPAARWVSEFYPCERVEEFGEGRLRVELRVADTAWVRRLLLRLGNRARVVAPAALADEVRESARTALAAYAD
jgi:proteasome accessory factor C